MHDFGPETAYTAGDPDFAGRALLVVDPGRAGGGKSTLLGELARRGWTALPGPGRQILEEQARVGGPGLPWTEPVRSAELAPSRAMHFFASAGPEGRVALFDRSVVDAVTALERLGAAKERHAEAARVYRAAPRVFPTPPREALFAEDAQRRHVFAEAVAEYEAPEASFAAKGQATAIVPRGGAAERADRPEAELGR